ncbi:RutC family protein YoaB [Salmonella enterica subsp. enterica serovar Choleraesuis]|nr:RutC family protein YoaB [Salmonella enterica subsp. enterica serovar Choleraesuis]
MTIKRIDTQPRWSEIVIHNNTLYYTSVPDNLDGDAYEQTMSALAQIEAALISQGSDKTKILDATILLPNLADAAEMNRAWDSWVPAGHAPTRCAFQAQLMNPRYKVEIKIIAAVD